jgi:hypothetical protein
MEEQYDSHTNLYVFDGDNWSIFGEKHGDGAKLWD